MRSLVLTSARQAEPREPASAPSFLRSALRANRPLLVLVAPPRVQVPMVDFEDCLGQLPALARLIAYQSSLAPVPGTAATLGGTLLTQSLGS